MPQASNPLPSGSNSGTGGERDTSGASSRSSRQCVSAQDGNDGSSSCQGETYARFVSENEFTFRGGGSQEYLFDVDAGDVCQIVLPLKPDHRTIAAKSYVVAARCLTAAQEPAATQLGGWPVSDHLKSTYRYMPEVNGAAQARIPQFVIPQQVALLGLRVFAWPPGCGLPAPCAAPPYLVMGPSGAHPEQAEFGLVRFHSQVR
ncbi:MAG: hypothetical protein JW940_11230 [Polyangiaceae bacterium]|nr:hypothetical protein [Polyangiaceae bacterium]